MIKKIKNLFTQNLLLKLFSFGFALLLWMFVSLGQTASEVPKKVRVELKNMPNELIRTSDLVHELEIKVSGRRNFLRSIRDNKLRYVIDLDGATVGTTNYRVYVPRIEGIPDGVKITQITPSQFNLTLSKRKRKAVRVNPVMRGKPAEGSDVIGRRVVPEFVEVSGAEEEVDILTMVDTEIIDVSGKEETFSFRVGLDLVGRHVELVEQQDVQVTVYLGAPQVKRMFQGVRIEVRNSLYRYRLSRDRLDVQLEGPQSELTRLTPEDILLVLDASNLKPGKQKAELEIELPEGMSLGNIDLPSVQIHVFSTKQKTVKKKIN